MTTKNISHIIFDLDGLLLDTEGSYTHMMIEFARQHNCDDASAVEAVRSQMFGRKPIESAAILFKAIGLPIKGKEFEKTFEEYLEWRKPILIEMFKDVEPMPGAFKLIQHFHTHNIPQAIATSSDRTTFEVKMKKRQDWLPLFDVIITGDQIENSKPEPDIFLKTAKELNAKPEQCLVFEDAESGMKAAQAANMSVIIVPDQNADKTVFESADEVLNSLEDFESEKWSLPPLL